MPWWPANDSRGVKGDGKGFGWGFVVLEPFGENPQRKRLDVSDSLRARRAVAHRAREGGDLGDPAAVILPLKLDG